MKQQYFQKLSAADDSSNSKVQKWLCYPFPHTCTRILQGVILKHQDKILNMKEISPFAQIFPEIVCCRRQKAFVCVKGLYFSAVGKSVIS